MFRNRISLVIRAKMKYDYEFLRNKSFAPQILEILSVYAMKSKFPHMLLIIFPEIAISSSMNSSIFKVLIGN